MSHSAKEKNLNVPAKPEIVKSTTATGEEFDEEYESLLRTDPRYGLTDEIIRMRVERFGPNSMVEKKNNLVLKFLSYFAGPISYLLQVAAIIAAIVGSWIDFGILVFVLVFNAIIGFHEEAKAESALEALKNTLALKTRCYRNGSLVEIDASTLVPGDIIIIRLGDIVPADCRLLGIGASGEITESKLHIDQSSLTGESLPVQKGKGEIAYSSSIVKQGQMVAVVTKTGANTFIGRAANLISMTNDVGHFQKIINQIGNFLIIITVVLVLIILLIVLFNGKPMYIPDHTAPNGQFRETRDGAERFLNALKQVIVLTIAAIPIGLPTVMSVTMAVGANQLAKKQVIVKRLTAIEELASVSILCSDKTGTLTLNQLTVDQPYLCCRGNSAAKPQGDGLAYTEEEMLLIAFLCSEPGAHDPIESAVRKCANNKVKLLRDRIVHDHNVPGYRVINFKPFDPVTKYTEATIEVIATKETFKCIKGAPQVIIEKCGGNPAVTEAVYKFAERGLRALGVAKTIDADMKKFETVGLISLLDPPRPDSAQTIKDCQELGVSVKMITGDQVIIGKEVARRLGMPRTILDATKLDDKTLDEEAITDRVVKADGFAQVIPEHKYRVVELLQNRGYLVGMTGDGVNDAPALKKANVGIAVEGCTDAARSAADIVLLAPGLTTVVDGIKTARTIFQRMRSYALYRIASTIHFLVFFFISQLAFNFVLSDRLIILIAVLNDLATLVISVDNAKINKRPDKWRLGQLLTLSTILGVLLVGISFAHYAFATQWYYDTHKQHSSGMIFVPNAHDHFVRTVMYLQISSCPHFVIFSTRLEGWFWESIPSFIFFVAVLGTQIFAMFMSIYGVEVFDAHAIGWGWGIGVICTSLASFMLLDIIKVLVIRNWSFELTAKLWPVKSRVEKLRKREHDAEVRSRVRTNTGKVKKAVAVVEAVHTWQTVVRESISKRPEGLEPRQRQKSSNHNE
jgi:H+-transporting ATPase